MSMVVDIEDVDIFYGQYQAVNGITFSIKAGETYGLVGLNGAGKTSLIKAILGLRMQQNGRIEICGRATVDKGAREGVVYLPERFDPPWFLSGMEFIKFSQKIYGRPFDRLKVIEYAEKLALDPQVLGKRVQTYSKGMRQKLGLISTIIVQCNLMILDEPMSGLDPLARALVKDLILETKSQGQTILLCSHILADLDEMCDRISVLHDKTIQFTGPPEDMKAANEQDNLERAFLRFIKAENVS